MSYFGELIEDLVEFDALNTKNFKYFNTDNNPDIFKIKKMRFKHSFPHMINKTDEVDIIFNLKENTIKGLFIYNGAGKNIDMQLENWQKLNILFSIDSNKIIHWNERNYQKGAYDFDCITCDGYRWRLDLQFDDESILSFSSSNQHPDTYPFFAMDIINITGFDFLRLDQIHYEKLNLYKKYGSKYLNE